MIYNSSLTSSPGPVSVCQQVRVNRDAPFFDLFVIDSVPAYTMITGLYSWLPPVFHPATSPPFVNRRKMYYFQQSTYLQSRRLIRFIKGYETLFTGLGTSVHLYFGDPGRCLSHAPRLPLLLRISFLSHAFVKPSGLPPLLSLFPQTPPPRAKA